MTEHSELRAVAAALRSAREARGVSLRAMAARMGIAPATLSACETGHSQLTVQRLSDAARILDVPLARLATGRRTLPASGSEAAPRRGPQTWRDYEPLSLGPILEAALRVFVEKGFHAATVRDVAAAAGMSVAGIYRDHPSKTDLLIDLFDRGMSEIRWRVLAAREEEGGDEVERFAAMVESLALVHATLGDLALLGYSELRGLPGAERARFTAQRAGVQHLLDDQAGRALRESRPAVAVDPEDLRVTTRAISTMCTSLPRWFDPHGAIGAREVARKYATLAVAMLGLDVPENLFPH